jgi:hypothetical protein
MKEKKDDKSDSQNFFLLALRVIAIKKFTAQYGDAKFVIWGSSLGKTPCSNTVYRRDHLFSNIIFPSAI